MDDSIQPQTLDPLTGLLTASEFMKLLMQAKVGASLPGEAVVGMINLDRFKAMNDRYGPTMGDAVLKSSAERLSNYMKTLGSAARLGGDIFGVLFTPSVLPAMVEDAAHNFVEVLALPVECNGDIVFPGASIGLTRCDFGTDVSEIVRQADKALQLAKTAGRGSFRWYTKDLERPAAERIEIEADLRSAIDNSIIEPWFQPIIELENDRLTGFEVLARWEHEKNWWVPPVRFIETAEHCGLIDNLSLDIFKKACRYAKEWPSDITISFNISPHQFRDPYLVSNIKKIIDETGFAPERLTLEITESTVIQEFSSARSKLDALRELGIKIALDDFGTGFSSLSNLGHLPIDRIKVDRSFITNIQAKPHNQKIVKGILSLAKGLGIEVTVEGIETTSDLEFLRLQGCILGQGFLFHRAVPPGKVTSLLDSKWRDGTVAKKPPTALLQHRPIH